MNAVPDDGQTLAQVDAETGIDLGLTHYAVTSDGEKIANPKWLRRRERKLKKLQRALARRRKGSANRAKARVRLARQHANAGQVRPGAAIPTLAPPETSTAQAA
jgi:putative transposase